MSSSSIGHLYGAVFPHVASALLLSLVPTNTVPTNTGMQNTAVREWPLNAVRPSVPVTKAQGPLPAVPRAFVNIKVNTKVAHSAPATVPASAPNVHNPFDIAVPSAISQPHGLVYNATDAQEASTSPAFITVISSKFIDHFTIHWSDYAIVIPLFFSPVLWIISCIICAICKAASIVRRKVLLHFNCKASYGVEAIMELSQACFAVSIVQLIRSTLPPGSGVEVDDPDLLPLFLGLRSAFRSMLCAIHIALQFRIVFDDSRDLIMLSVVFWFGLCGFLRGYGSTTDFATALFSATRSGNGRMGIKEPRNALLDVNSFTLEGAGYQDWSDDDESNDDKAYARWLELRAKAFRFATQNSARRGSRTRRSPHTETEVPVISYDGDDESEDDVPALKVKKDTTRVPCTKSARRSAPKKAEAKADRPAIHPSVKNILGPQLYEKMNRPKQEQVIKVAPFTPLDTQATAGPSKPASVKTTPASKATLGVPTTPVAPISSYLLPPARTPKHARFSSTPKEAQKIHKPKASLPSSPSVWSPADIPSVPNVVDDFGIGSEPIPSIHISPAPATTKTPEPLATSAGIEDALNATFDISREWIPYGGDDEFVRRVETKAAAGSTIEEATNKANYEMKLILGSGLFLNEEGVETVCTRALKQSRPAVLDKLDAILAK